MSKKVCYGDQVYIEINNRKTDKRLFCSSGYLDETIYGVITSDYEKSCFRNCIFTIRPSLVEHKEELSTISSLRAELSSLSISKPQTFGERILTRDIDYKENQINQGKENLEALNKKILLEMAGKPVHYGDVVVLEHLESGYYLCVDNSPHPNNPNLKNLKLHNGTVNACYFRFFSYNDEEDRSLINYESDLKLVSTYLSSIVTMEDNKSEDNGLKDLLKERVDIAESIFPFEEKRRDGIIESFTQEYHAPGPMVVGTSPKSDDNNMIKLFEYCSKQQLDDFEARKVIKNGDYVRFQIEDYYLTGSYPFNRKNKISDLLQLDKQNNEGYPYDITNSIFQIVAIDKEARYPIGYGLQTIPNVNDKGNTEKVHLRHLASGQNILSSENKVEYGSYSNRTWIQLVNNQADSKTLLSQNSTICLKIFETNSGHFFALQSEIEKFEAPKPEIKSNFYKGSENSEDKLKIKLNSITRSLTYNKTVGCSFRTALINDEEIKKVLELESYNRSLTNFTRLIASASAGKLVEEIFNSELKKILLCSEKLRLLTKTHDQKIQIIIREFKILDVIARVFIHLQILELPGMDIDTVIKVIENLSSVIMNVIDNSLNLYYFTQYVRLFIGLLTEPFPLSKACSNQQLERLKDLYISVLLRILREKNSETLGQVIFYRKRIAKSLNNQKDYSTHLFKLIHVYFKDQQFNLDNTLRQDFLPIYVSNPDELRKIFPKITFVKEKEDFEIEFDRDNYPAKMKISEAPVEVHNYLIWTFKVIASSSKVFSLKFWNIIKDYYSQDLCELMIKSSKIQPELKISILTALRDAYAPYNKLPFDHISPKIQLLFGREETEEWLKLYQTKIQEAKRTLISPLEKETIHIESVSEINIHKISLELLQQGFDQFQNGSPSESLRCILQIIKKILDEEDLSLESLKVVHKSLSVLVKRFAEESESQPKSRYYDACINYVKKIFKRLLQFDEHIARQTFQEIIPELKEKILQIMRSNFNKTASDITDDKSLNFVLNSVLKEWKSKEKLYQSEVKTVDSIYLENSLMKDLWKIVKNGDNKTINSIINLMREKMNFEERMKEQFVQSSFIAGEKELGNFRQLITSLLTLNRIMRRINLRIEFKLKEKEDEGTLNEIVENLENIFLIIYDFELHMQEEQSDMSPEVARKVFQQRIYNSKKAENEVPFKHKSNCIKRFYQKALSILQAHKIIVPFVHILVSKKGFKKEDNEKFKIGYCLAMIITNLFMHKNATNQNLISKYPEFVTLFCEQDIEEFYEEENYEEQSSMKQNFAEEFNEERNYEQQSSMEQNFAEGFHEEGDHEEQSSMQNLAKGSSTQVLIEKSSVEAVFMFIEMCRDNVELLQLKEYFIQIVMRKLAKFYNELDSNSLDDLSINYFRGLNVICSSQIPKEVFNGSDFINKTLNKFTSIFQLSIMQLFEQFNDNFTDQNQTNVLTETVGSNKKVLILPNSYLMLKEFLASIHSFALMDIKEDVLNLQNPFGAEGMLYCFQSIEFKFDLKQLTLEIFETINLKTEHKNNDLFLDYDKFISFASLLLIDVFVYLKYRIGSDNDEIFEIINTQYFSSEQNKEHLERYEKLLVQDLDSFVLLEYQSLVSFSTMWKNYIYYVLCELFATFLTNFDKFMLSNKEKGQYNIFDLWLKLVLKMRSIDADPISYSKLDEVLKNTLLMPQYSNQKELASCSFEASDKIAELVKARQKVSLATYVEKLLSKWLEGKPEENIQHVDSDFAFIASTLEFNRAVIIKLITLIRVPQTPVNQMLFVLKLLRKLIEIENKTLAPGKYLWDKIAEGDLNRIRRIQIDLAELQVDQAIFDLFYRYQKDKVVIGELLLLCIALLFGGNQIVQDTFYERFKADYQNTVLIGLIQTSKEILESLRINDSQEIEKSYLKALRYIFDCLGELPTSSMSDSLVITEDLKEKMSLNYRKKVINTISGQRKDDYSLLVIIMKFLQNLCEGHHLKFQRFLCDQAVTSDLNSLSVLQFLANCYNTYYKNINDKNIEIGLNILDLLIEIQQGESKASFEVLSQKTFIRDLCNTLVEFNTELDLLSRGFDTSLGSSKFMQLKHKILTLLKDLVERSDSNNLLKLNQSINPTALILAFKENIAIFQKKKGGYPQREDLVPEDIWDPNLGIAYLVYMILKYLSANESFNNFTPEIQEGIKQVIGNEKDTSELVDKYLYQFFKEYTGSVEIFDQRLNKLMRIHFPIPIVYDYIKSETKNEFEDRVDRSSAQAKIADFMNASTEIIGLAFVEYNSRKKLFNLNFYTVYEWLRLLTNITAVIIVTFDIIGIGFAEGALVYKVEEDNQIKYLLCFLQIFFSLALIFIWLQTYRDRTLAAHWDAFVRANVKEKGELPQDIIKKLDDGEDISKEDGETILLLKGPYSDQWKKVESTMGNTLSSYNLKFTFKSGAFQWHLMYFVICFGSIFHPLFAALQLFDIIVRSDTVNRIAMAVAKNLKQFVWTIVLLIVTIYVFSVIGFSFFYQRFEDSYDENMCEDAFSCFIANLNYGLRSGGGIGDVIKKVDYNPEEKGMYLLYTLFDLSFFIIIITILLNLIFGMIIDAFGDLRDEKNKNDDDRENICFICGLERSEYERTSDFDAHITEDHNMWNYLAYIIYLKEKKKSFSTELTDIEDYVLNLYKKGEFFWIPIGRSLTLEKKVSRTQKPEYELMKQELIESIREKIGEQNQLFDKMKQELVKAIESRIKNQIDTPLKDPTKQHKMGMYESSSEESSQ